jgi:hypothetical protein
MVVLWQLDDTQEATISWGLTPDLSTGSIRSVEYGDDHQHRATIGDLAPSTLYHYAIEAGDEKRFGSFRSAPGLADASLNFFGIADSQYRDNTFRTICGEILEIATEDPSFQTIVVHAGDWIENGPWKRYSKSCQESDWASFFSSRGTAEASAALLSTIPFQGCIGNHDMSAMGDPRAYDGFGKYWPYPYAGGHYWQFDFGPARFVVLEIVDVPRVNAIDYEPGSAQFEWMCSALEKAQDRPWTIVLFHDPIQIPGSLGNSIDNDSAVETLWPEFVKYGVDLVIAGHYHWEPKLVVHESVAQYVMPASSGTGESGFSAFSISGSVLGIVAYHADGTESSRFTVRSRR